MAATRPAHKDLVPTTGDGPNDTVAVTVTATTTSTVVEQQWRDVVAQKIDKRYPASLNLEDGHCAD